MTKARNLADNALTTVSPTELGFLDGVTSAVQTQIDGKTGKSTLTTTGDIYYASAANTPARIGIGSTSQVLTVAGGIPSWAAPAGGAIQSATFTDTRASGTDGSSSVSGAFRTRDLNTTQFNNITSANLTSNQISLPAGTYYVVANAPAYLVSVHQTRFQNVTDTTTAILGSNAYIANTDNAMTHSMLSGTFTITGTKTFELQHRFANSQSGGMGISMNWGDEVYGRVSIMKVG